MFFRALYSTTSKLPWFWDHLRRSCLGGDISTEVAAVESQVFYPRLNNPKKLPKDAGVVQDSNILGLDWGLIG